MRKRRPEDVLEDYLNERTIPDDPELASLSRVADRLERGLTVDVPESGRERALFIQGAAARKRGFPWGRLLVPLTAASMLVAVVSVSREAGPGDALYGVRKALDKVGLAPGTARDANKLLDRAEGKIVDGEELVEDRRYRRARAAATEALHGVQEARELLEDASGEAREEGLDRAGDVEQDALDIREEIRKEHVEQREEEEADEAFERAQERVEREDSSGKGGGEDSGGSGSGRDSGGPGGND